MSWLLFRLLLRLRGQYGRKGGKERLRQRPRSATNPSSSLTSSSPSPPTPTACWPSATKTPAHLRLPSKISCDKVQSIEEGTLGREILRTLIRLSYFVVSPGSDMAWAWASASLTLVFVFPIFLLTGE